MGRRRGKAARPRTVATWRLVVRAVSAVGGWVAAGYTRNK